MKYKKTIEIGNDESEQLAKGQLVLQAGQWIRLAWSSRKARWVGVMPSGTLWAVHWDNGHDTKKFSSMCKTRRDHLVRASARFI